LIGKENETASFTFDEVHVEGARRIARIARECGVKRLIHVSSISASPNPVAAIKSPSGFLKSKYYGELAVREEFPEAVILRPSDMYGEEDRFFIYWTHWYRRSNRKILLWNKGRGVYKQPVFVSDVAQGIINSIYDNTAAGKTYDAVGPKRYELHDLVDYINRCTSRDETHAYTLSDMRFHPFFWLRVFLTEQVRKEPTMCWDKIEREMTSDILTPGAPTLEDLGVKLTLFESLAPYYLKSFDRLGYYDTELGEVPKPLPPKSVPLATV
jgi:NADH dehydrogenase (ubiquinone) 1 alpha subcomplex subunit 9